MAARFAAAILMGTLVLTWLLALTGNHLKDEMNPKSG